MPSGDAPRPGPRKLPQQERSRALFDSIMEGARLVIESRGIDFTLAEVATRAGVSPGSLYQYFPDRHALVGALIDEQIAGDRRRLETARELLNEASAEALPALVATGVVSLYRQNPKLLTSMVRLMHELGRHDDLQAVVAEFSTLVCQRLCQLYPERPEGQLQKSSSTAVFAALGAARHTAELTPEELTEPAFEERIAMIVRAALGL